VNPEVESEDWVFNCWPDQKPKHRPRDVIDRIPSGLTPAQYERKKILVKNNSRVCNGCNLTLLHCGGGTPCGPCARDGYQGQNPAKNCGNTESKRKAFKHRPSKLNRMETIDCIGFQSSKGSNEAKTLPVWTRKDRFAPPSFIRTQPSPRKSCVHIQLTVISDFDANRLRVRGSRGFPASLAFVRSVWRAGGLC
jgi:hypothetical protein